jgi:hypothetical protein
VRYLSLYRHLHVELGDAKKLARIHLLACAMTAAHILTDERYIFDLLLIITAATLHRYFPYLTPNENIIGKSSHIGPTKVCCAFVPNSAFQESCLSYA